MASTAASADEAAFIQAFDIACLSDLSDLDGYEARLAEAGFVAGRGGARSRDGFTYTVSEPQTPRNRICGGVSSGLDPVLVGQLALSRATARGYGVESATRKGRRTSIGLRGPQGGFEIAAEPQIAGSARLTIVRIP